MSMLLLLLLPKPRDSREGEGERERRRERKGKRVKAGWRGKMKSKRRWRVENKRAAVFCTCSYPTPLSAPDDREVDKAGHAHNLGLQPPPLPSPKTERRGKEGNKDRER